MYNSNQISFLDFHHSTNPPQLLLNFFSVLHLMTLFLLLHTCCLFSMLWHNSLCSPSFDLWQLLFYSKCINQLMLSFLSMLYLFLSLLHLRFHSLFVSNIDHYNPFVTFFYSLQFVFWTAQTQCFQWFVTFQCFTYIFCSSFSHLVAYCYLC